MSYLVQNIVNACEYWKDERNGLLWPESIVQHLPKRTCFYWGAPSAYHKRHEEKCTKIRFISLGEKKHFLSIKKENISIGDSRESIN